jgi:nucleoside-diphosphate-sugar epimerase
VTSVLVTGGTGFVGSAVVAALRRAGRPATVALRRPNADLPADVRRAIVGEIGPDTDWREALEGVDSVIHLAARVHVMQETETDVDAAFEQVNGAGSRRLAEAVDQAGLRRMVLVSSVKVNGERTGIDQGFTGEQPPAPEDAYGRSKLSAERHVRGVLGSRAVIVRPPLVYGPGVGGNLAVLMRAIARGAPLPFGAIRNRRSLIARENLASALLAALDHPDVAARSFTLADGSDFSTPDLIRAIAEGMGKKAWIPAVPESLLRFAGRVAGRRATIDRLCGSLVVDPSVFMAATGWRPAVAPGEAIAEMAAAYR